MKLPFHTILGPSLSKHSHFLKSTCSNDWLLLGSEYVPILSLIGCVLAFFDVYNMIKYGPVLSRAFQCNQRAKAIACFADTLGVSEEFSSYHRRDLKLIGTVFILEHYFLLFLGYLTANPVLYFSWLIVYSFIIVLEFFIFVASFFCSSKQRLQKRNLLATAFIIFNWLSIFCAFKRLLCMCDL